MSDPRPLLDLKNDYVFKRLFVEAPDLLAELINAVRCNVSAVLRHNVPRCVPGSMPGTAGGGR